MRYKRASKAPIQKALRAYVHDNFYNTISCLTSRLYVYLEDSV